MWKITVYKIRCSHHSYGCGVYVVSGLHKTKFISNMFILTPPFFIFNSCHKSLSEFIYYLHPSRSYFYWFQDNRKSLISIPVVAMSLRLKGLTTSLTAILKKHIRMILACSYSPLVFINEIAVLAQGGSRHRRTWQKNTGSALFAIKSNFMELRCPTASQMYVNIYLLCSVLL